MKKIIASAAAALLVAGGIVAAIAAPASAHTGDLNVSYTCDATTGEYVGTATLDISRTDLVGATSWRVGTEAFQGTPSSTAGMDRGPVGSNGSGTITLGTFRIPGTTTTKGPWVYAHTTWSDNYKQGSDGQVRKSLKGDCKPPKPGQPRDKVETVPGAWVDGTWSCGDTTVTQTRILTTTTTPAVWDEHAWQWVDGAPIVTTSSETQTRQLAPDELKSAQSTNPSGECFVPPTNVCTAPGVGTTSTNLVPLWSNVDTRSAGHYEYVENGLHVWTDDATSQAKVSLGYAAAFPLQNTGVLDIDWTGSTPAPGINLFVNFGADGTGTLVYESVYGQDLWLTNGSSAAVKANAPVNGGGNGSQWHGTIDQWLAKYPGAQVTGIAFSLGSGVKGDGTINSITAGCATYLFDYVAPAPKPEPTTERDETVTYGEWSTPEVTCDSEVGDEVAISREVYTTPRTRTTGEPTYDAQTNTWTQGAFGEWADGETVTTIEDGTYTVTAEDIAELTCPTPTPTPTPSETPAPTPTVTATPAPTGAKLAVTGGETVAALTAGALGIALLGLGTVLTLKRRRG